MAKQKDGRYRAKVTIGHRPDGEPIYKYASGRTKKELEAAKEELLRIHVTGAVDSRRDIMFTDYVMEWYETYKKPHLSASSKQNYTTILNNHVLPAFAARQIRAITAPELQRFLNDLGGYGKTTINYAKTIIQSVFNLAYVSGIIDRDPARALKKPAADSKNRRALTDAETKAVLTVGNEHPEGLILLLLYYTGARRGEALGLQWRDIDFENRTISISRDVDFVANAIGGLKTAYSERIVPMPEALMAVLNPLRGIGETFVLQSPMTHGYLAQSTFVRRWRRLMQALYAVDNSIENKIIKEHTDKAGNTTQIRASILTPHYFRHNYASTLYNSGVDILAAQKYLGHADVKTTLSIYAHLAENREDENAQKVRDAFKAQEF